MVIVHLFTRVVSQMEAFHDNNIKSKYRGSWMNSEYDESNSLCGINNSLAASSLVHLRFKSQIPIIFMQ